MIDEAKSKEIAFNQLSLIENVRYLTLGEKKENGFLSSIDIWEVDTEILVKNELTRLILHISFENQFPFDFPQIYLSNDSFDKTKYIPHVDSKRLVCTFDSEISLTNPLEPTGIIIECLRRAKTIIKEGLLSINHSDFEDEFKAYWENKYAKEKHLPQDILVLIDTLEDDSNIKLICLKEAIQHYNYVLHASDILFERFKHFLDEYKLEYDEVDVFYLKNNAITKPPFDLKNKDVKTLIENSYNEQLKSFKAFINKNEYPKLVICKKNISNKEFIFGWFHLFLKTNIAGFRPGKFKPFNAFTSTQSNDSVERISTDVYTPERLSNRTSGIDTLKNEKCIAIAGVGSIGSNLLYFLNSINYPEFRFIDKELIELENIGRHLLGFEYIGVHKTKALKDYILKKNPLQKVSTKENSIIDVIKNDTNYLNEADYIFISIGKTNIDNWVCQSLVEGKITKPIFIIWVEPYLCGGHCLYLHPLEPDFEKYFDDGLFKFNVIDSFEYKNSNKFLSLREAGCQSTYVPYSGANVICFISTLFPVISSIIDSSITKSSSYSWFGNIDSINELKIKTSEYYKDKVSGTLIEHKL